MNNKDNKIRDKEDKIIELQCFIDEIKNNTDAPPNISRSEREIKDRDAIKIVNRYLDDSKEYPKEDAINLLKEYIEQASETALEDIFNIARSVRKDGNIKRDIAVKNKDLEGESNAIKLFKKTIPIFEILIEINPEFHRYYAQKAYAIKGLISKSSKYKHDDKELHLWQETLELLNLAIAKRKLNYDQGFYYPLYEINRAICRINIDDNYKEKKASNLGNKGLIESDIKYFLNADKRLGINLEDHKKLNKWCSINKNKNLQRKLNRFKFKLR